MTAKLTFWSVKFEIFETQFAKVNSLEIFSHKNIFSQGIIINLTTGFQLIFEK